MANSVDPDPGSALFAQAHLFENLGSLRYITNKVKWLDDNNNALYSWTEYEIHIKHVKRCCYKRNKMENLLTKENNQKQTFIFSWWNQR